MGVQIVAAILLLVSSHIAITSASKFHNKDKFDIRALSDSPSGSYSPAIVQCPTTSPTIRGAGSGLSSSEREWLIKRRAATVQPMKDFMSRANIKDFDVESYLDTQANDVANLPNIGIAVSGGGYRALMNGAGILTGMDSRTSGSTGPGGLGGLLQSATYLTGLSGGGWLVGSLYANNFTAVQDILDNTSVWQFQNTIFGGPFSGVVDTVEYWTDIYDQVSGKSDAGFQTSVTDYWGRALSYQLVGAANGGPAYTWSSIAQEANFLNGNLPMPMLVADERDPGAIIVSLNATNYEIGPWEIGSFDPTVFGFVPTQYVGSNFSAGSIPGDGKCVEGMDQLGFVMGTSSTLFNEFLLTNISAVADVPSFIGDALHAVASVVGSDNNDIAQWVPNPFQGFNPSINPNAHTNNLSLVDGGEDLQNIPLSPLVQPVRAVDVIYAIDSSADTTTNWPNGTALRATYERSLVQIANGTLFPPVPDDNTFINLGLNNRPTFFGCDASNFTLATGQAPPPLVVYLPNAPYTNNSNVTTFDPSYSLGDRDDIIANGLNASSQGAGSLDAEWPACMACAALSRSLTRTGTSVPSGCSACFDRYCWNGTLDTTKSGVYEPNLKAGAEGANSKSAGVKSRNYGAWKIVLGSWCVVASSVLLSF